MRKKAIRICTLMLLLMLLTGCAGRSEPAPVPTQSPPTPTQAAPTQAAPPPTAEPSPTPDALAISLDKVRGMIDEGHNYAAFQELLALEESCRGDAEGTARCEALFAELDRRLRDIEPASGTELARSFTVQGGCVLEINAFSGPVLVAVSDAMAEPGTVPNSVRFYVRQGELGSVHLPAGTYYVGYEVGYRWFGEADGFGEYYTEGTLSAPLVFDFYMDGAWASNAKYTITL